MATPPSEDELVTWLRSRIAGNYPDGLGDDVAELGAVDKLVATVDQHIAGVHLPRSTPPAAWARRLLAVNLSDLAAAGATPWRALLSVGAPTGWDHREFFEAFLQAANHYGLHLAGGDLACTEEVHLSLTLLGTRCGNRLGREQARSRDRLWVGGSLGLGALGLQLVQAGARYSGATTTAFAPSALERRTNAEVKIDLQSLAATDPAAPPLGQEEIDAARRAILHYYEPTPQLEIGGWLATLPRAAAMDLSDGLAKDLTRLCRESQVGAQIDARSLPIDPGSTALARRLALSTRQLAFSGGDDYRLLFAIPPEIAPPPEFACSPIGRLTESSELVVLDGPHRHLLGADGWDHLR